MYTFILLINLHNNTSTNEEFCFFVHFILVQKITSYC